MKTVWKYPLRPQTTIIMPVGAEPLAVDEQDGALMLWALVDPHAPRESRSFIVAGTGHPIDSDTIVSYIGTSYMRNLELVFHVFEVTS